MRFLEMHLEVDNLEIAEQFYARLLPHSRIARWDDGSAVALILEDGTAFGLWKKGKLGLFGGQGAKHLHFAFQVSKTEIEMYKNRLHDLGVDVIEHTWPSGDLSLYFFDPDGHQGEFMSKDWLTPFR